MFDIVDDTEHTLYAYEYYDINDVVNGAGVITVVLTMDASISDDTDFTMSVQVLRDDAPYPSYSGTVEIGLEDTDSNVLELTDVGPGATITAGVATITFSGGAWTYSQCRADIE